jgi:hypothetical protein
MKGMDTSAINRPNVNGTPKTRGPYSFANHRPHHRPKPVADNDGQTVITVTSFNCDGATPEMACFM